MWTSWKGCARSEPCRPTASTPKSGASTSSPTPVTAPPGINRAGLCHPHTPLTTPLCSPPRRLPRQLRRLHGLGGASRQDHGAGPARWGAPDARLHDGQEEDLGHLCLLRVHALQGGEGELLPCWNQGTAVGISRFFVASGRRQLVSGHGEVAESSSSSSPRSTPRRVTSITTAWRRTPASSTPS